MRAILTERSLDSLFSSLEKAGLNTESVATVAGVSSRTVRDWRRGKYTIPAQSLEKLTGVAGLDSNSLGIRLVDDWAHTTTAGRKGAQARRIRHGRLKLGTSESRRLGGANSYKIRRDKTGDIFTRKAVSAPSKNADLAEFIGIMIGDGCLTPYQASIALSSLVDQEYSVYVSELTQRLFGMAPHAAHRNNANCITLTCSSANLVELLVKYGLPIGDKIRHMHDIPAWIKSDRELAAACLRGIFDTDGCIFLERHDIKGKSYCYPRMSFVSASAPLRASIHLLLTELGFDPRARSNRSVNLETKVDISRYFDMIGSSNPKHLDRFYSFGGVG